MIPGSDFPMASHRKGCRPKKNIKPLIYAQFHRGCYREEVFGSFDGAMRQHVTSVCVCARAYIYQPATLLNMIT